VESEGGDWTEERLAGLESMLAQLGELAPERSNAARQRLHQRLVDSINESLRRPRLEPEDVTQIEQRLGLLAGRDASSATVLRQSLQQRLRRWQPVFEIAKPYSDLRTLIDRNDIALQDEVLVRPFPATALEGPD